MAPGLGQQPVELLLIVALAEQLLRLMQHLADAKIAGADRGVHVIHRGVVDRPRQPFEVDAVDVEPAELAVEDRLALVEVLLPRLQLEPGLDLGACARGADIAQVGVDPVTARRTLGRGEDLDLLAGLEQVG